MNKKISLLLLASLVFVGCNSTKVQENETQVKASEQNDIVEIDDESFIQQMEEIHANLDEYEGKTVSYEGFVAKVGEEGKEYTVVRNYDSPHEDHTHAIYVGLYSIYEGEWPAEDAWVRVTGKIREKNMDGQVYPAIEVEELKIMDVRGQEKVNG